MKSISTEIRRATRPESNQPSALEQRVKALQEKNPKLKTSVARKRAKQQLIQERLVQNGGVSAQQAKKQASQFGATPRSSAGKPSKDRPQNSRKELAGRIKKRAQELHANGMPKTHAAAQAKRELTPRVGEAHVPNTSKKTEGFKKRKKKTGAKKSAGAKKKAGVKKSSGKSARPNRAAARRR